MPEPARSPDLDKAVAAMAKLLFVQAHDQGDAPWGDQPESVRAECRHQARALLEAALPHLPSPEQVREDTAVEAASAEARHLYDGFEFAPHKLRAIVEAAKPFIVAEALREVEEALREQAKCYPPDSRYADVGRGHEAAADFVLALFRDRFRAGDEGTHG